MHRLLIAAAAAGGLLTTSYALSPAQAAPLSPATAEAPSKVVTPVAQGMRGGGMRGGGMGMRGMGGMGSRGLGSRGMGIGRPHIGPGRGFRGGSAFRGVGRGHGHHGHHHHHRRFYYAAPFVGYGAYYGDSYYGGSGCGWLRRRAEATGSGYWWSRYEECLDENS